MTKLALATKSAALEQRIRQAFDGQLNGELVRWQDPVDTRDMRSLAGELTPLGAEVVAVGPDVPIDVALDLARAFERSRPEVAVVVITDPTPQLYEQALRSGVADLVASDASDADLRRALERALQTTDRRRRNLTGFGGGAGRAGRVITVVAPKGGSGKTVTATNLGVGLAQSAPGRVVLVDLDLQFGDVTSSLALRPEHTFADVVDTPGVIDATSLKVYLTKRDPGLYVLCAPDEPATNDVIDEALVHRVIDLLADEFDYVVVDTAAGLDEHSLAALELSTDLVLLCDLSVPGVRGMRKLREALDVLEMTEATRHVVLNRADSRVGLELADVAALVGHTVDIRLPSARAVALSMNEGAPIVETAPRSAFSRRITELVARFVPVPARRGLFRR